MGDITPRLLRAYRQTRYSVGPITVLIGRRSVASDTLLANHGFRTAVLVTAWNPASRPMPEGWNRRMQRALAERLRGRVVCCAEGAWRGWREDHMLVFGSPCPVVVLAWRFRQTAVVQVRRGAIARLLAVR